MQRSKWNKKEVGIRAASPFFFQLHFASFHWTCKLTMTNDEYAPATVLVTYQGIKVEKTLTPGLTVADLKEELIAEHVRHSHDETLLPKHLKVLFSGMTLPDSANLRDVLLSKRKKSQYRLVATGVSSSQSEALDNDMRLAARAAPRIRDDLTVQGRAEDERRRLVGQSHLQRSAKRSSTSPTYGFGRIETLPNLPDQDQAREILTRLANDPGVLACMAKHRWNVGCLSEIFPEGKVGESAVCLMGLNEGKGRRIRLRIRTDDLNGFRKMLSIRQVLFHELAHNVHSEHDDKFFQLMRQIERECNELDWTQGHGLSISDDSPRHMFTGGTYRLGGDAESADHRDVRELAAQAALTRMTAEEEEIQMNCGCGREDLFLPPKSEDSNSDSSATS
jgi:WLM domain